MSLIDSSYFVGEIDIPNIDERPNTIEFNIEKFEKEFLICLLGRELYDDFIEGLEEATPEQKWLDLRDGANFDLEYCGKTIPMTWEGLVNTEKFSPIAFYVYYKIRLEELTTVTGSAEVAAEHENSVRANARRKMVNAWNRMLDMYGEIRYDDKSFDYNGYSYNVFPRYFINCFDKYSDVYDTYNDKPSVFNFLNSRREDYPGWIFSEKKKLNEFGI